MQPTMGKRKFSKEEKLRIIKEASEQGVTATLKKTWHLSGNFLQLEEKV